MTANMARGAVQASAASGFAYQLASASTMPTAVNADAALNIIELGTTLRFSFHEALGRLPAADPTGPPGIKAPPERLGEAEQRLLEDRHHQAVDDGPAGFLGFDEPGLLQHGEMGRHGRL